MRYFCSDQARARGDENMATATRLDVWILVEFPHTWGRKPLRDAGLPPAVQTTLQNALVEIPRSRVVFIRRRFEERSGCRVYIVRSAPEAWTLALDLPSIDDVATLPLQALAHGRPAREEPVSKPVVLVCTHGQRDSCCGRRGFPLYDALRNQPNLDVWQCSHIGGDRFAANAVVLPWGLYYGPVEPRDAGALAESVLRNEILLDSFRGRSSFPAIVQAAETFIRRNSHIRGRDELHFVSRDSLGNGRTRIRLRDDGGTSHVVTIDPYVSESAALMTCTSESPSPITQFRMLDYRAQRD